MLDTISITITNAREFIKNPDRFNPPLTYLHNPNPYAPFFVRHTCNEKSKQLYCPKLTVTPLPNSYHQPIFPLRIEFSAPKLIFKHNLDEVTENDLALVVQTLQQRLLEVEIDIPTTVLNDASVNIVHFCKNVLLSNFYTVSLVTDIFNKEAVSNRLGIVEKSYQNGGHALYFSNSSHQFILYDKVRDARQSLALAVDKDQTSTQKDLLKAIESHRYPLEIIRLEARLLTKAKIKSVFKSLGHAPSPRLSDIFDRTLAQKILKIYWDSITPDKTRFLLKNIGNNPLEHLIRWKRANTQSVTLPTLLSAAYLGWHIQEHGYRQLSHTVTNSYDPATFRRLDKKLRLFNQATEKLPYMTFVEDIEKSLKIFEPFKIVDYLNLDELDLVKSRQYPHAKQGLNYYHNSNQELKL